MILVLAAITLLWMLRPFRAISNQTDRIPFSHEAIEEQVTYFLRACRCTNLFEVTLTTLKDTKSVGSPPEMYTLRQSLPVWMKRKRLHTVTIVQAS